MKCREGPCIFGHKVCHALVGALEQYALNVDRLLVAHRQRVRHFPFAQALVVGVGKVMHVAGRQARSLQFLAIDSRAIKQGQERALIRPGGQMNGDQPLALSIRRWRQQRGAGPGQQVALQRRGQHPFETSQQPSVRLIHISGPRLHPGAALPLVKIKPPEL
ncbi:MAG: hypothetical protein B7Z22_05040 [Hyphomonas sp. 32-62-5]|nr:MAG: hypothetical protein B7Z22_05040 [Hyphomonas sp. 32-62-5]